MSFLRIIYFVLFLSFGLQIFGQNTQVEFGKNRVQYKNLSWQYLKGESFNTYFYLGGQELGKFVFENGPDILKEVEDFFQYQANEKIEVLVFTDLNDIYQTNVGYTTGLPSAEYVSPNTSKIVQGKLFVYFTGDHQDLLRQLKLGFTTIIVESMLNDRLFTDIVQPNNELYFPEWFTNGLIEYYVNGFSPEDIDHLRTLKQRKRYRKFLRIANYDQTLAGKSFWYFIEKKLGKKEVSGLIYMARIQRNLEYAFNYALALSSKEVFKTYDNFYTDAYQKANDHTIAYEADTTFKRRFKKRYIYYQLNANDEGTKVAYVRNFMGRYNVRSYDLVTGKRKTILSGSYRSNEKILDQSFPLLDWAPKSNKLTIMFEKRDEIYFKHYDFDTKEKTLVKQNTIQKVHDFSYGYTDQHIYLSGSQKGQSDLYRMHVESQRLSPMTNDIYDDLNPIFIKTKNREGVLFLSNRPYQIGEAFDWQQQHICFYDFKSKKNRIVRLTNHSKGNISHLSWKDDQVHYLSNETGVNNYYTGSIDTAFVKYDTIFYFNDSMLINPGNHQYYFYNQEEAGVEEVELVDIKRPHLYDYPTSNFNQHIYDQDRNDNSIFNFTRTKKGLRLSQTAINPLTETSISEFLVIEDANNYPSNQEEEGFIDTNNYYILQDFIYYDEAIDIKAEIEKEEYKRNLLRRSSGFKKSDILIYKPTIFLEYANLNLDNGTILTQYTLQGSRSSLSPMLRASAADLFEDYRFQAGMKLPLDFRDKEYFVSFDNNKKRLDKRILGYRRSSILRNDLATSNMMSNYIADSVTTKLLTNLVEARISWPFSETTSIRFSTTAKQDQGYLRAVEFNSLLPFTNYSEYRAYGRAEFVYDNSISLLQNIRVGTRFKTFYEYQKLLTQNQDYTNIIGADFRFHNRIHRLITFNNRIAIGQSFGSSNIAFTLGGLDGWIGARRDGGVERSEHYNFQQEAYVTHLRGYNQNVRNGNKYAVYNSEIRVPIIRYLNLPWYREFWQKLQFVGFGDLGTVWVGPSPFSDENPFSTDIYHTEGNPIKVTANYEIDPILKSIGWGVRSKIFGYYFKAERSYPHHNGRFYDAVWQVSTVLDF